MNEFQVVTDGRARSLRGAAAVEMALVLPILVLLVFGIVEFGRAYNAKIMLTHAAREGVREYSIIQDQGAAETFAEEAAPNLSGVTARVTALCDGTPGDVAEMTVSYSMDYTIPLFRSGTWNLSERATMRCGG